MSDGEGGMSEDLVLACLTVVSVAVVGIILLLDLGLKGVYSLIARFRRGDDSIARKLDGDAFWVRSEGGNKVI